MNVRQRIASKKAKANASTVRVSVQTMTARTMLAARQAGSDAVRHSAGLSGTVSLKTVMPWRFDNPLSEHTADSFVARIWKRDTDARNPFDVETEENARLFRLQETLRALGISR